MQYNHLKRSFQLGILLIMIPGLLYPQPKSEKRGLAFGKHSEADMAAISGNVSWWYNWYNTPESTVAKVYQNYGMDFVPMAWNGSFNEAGLRAFYASHPEAKYLLGFNEPNFTTQANMKPSQAAAIWPKLEKIAKDFNLKIVAPAVNYADKPVTENGVTYTDPIAYLDAFFAACPNCQVDYIAVHNYMCYTTALASDIARYKKYKRPIWLTEFACWDQPNITLDMQKSFILGAIDYLETDTSVFRYSWFTAGKRIGEYPYLDLFKPQSGQLTDLGKLYISFNPVHDTASYSLIPARLEAENYSRMLGIAIEATKDISSLADVGWFDANDWLEYNIEVPSSADYNVFFRISANTSSNIIIRENGVALKTLQVASSGGWQNWKTLKTTLALSPGKHKLQLFTNKGQFNLNWLEITTASQPTLVRINELADTRAYPNPVSNRLIIELDELSAETQITIVDMAGRIIFEKTWAERASEFEIDFSNFQRGSYIVQVKNDGKISNHLVVKTSSWNL